MFFSVFTFTDYLSACDEEIARTDNPTAPIFALAELGFGLDTAVNPAKCLITPALNNSEQMDLLAEILFATHPQVITVGDNGPVAIDPINN